jgi:ABC-type branched-subunit amino acid transport system permease subunit
MLRTQQGVERDPGIVMTGLSVGHFASQALPAVSPWIIPAIAGGVRALAGATGGGHAVRLAAKVVAVATIGVALLAVCAARACDAVGSDRVAIASDDSLLDFVIVRMDRTAPLTDTAFARETDRRAGRFLAFLAKTDPVAFRRMMNAVLVGCRFGDAVRTGYGTDTEALWRRFMQTE